MSEEIATRVAENRAQLEDAMAGRPGVALLAADGGWHAILRIGATSRGAAPDEDTPVASLLDGPGILVQPGWFFDLEPLDEAGAAVEPPLYPRRVEVFSKHRAFDISKAKRKLGYAPKVSLAEGFARTATWYREQGPP